MNLTKYSMMFLVSLNIFMLDNTVLAKQYSRKELLKKCTHIKVESLPSKCLREKYPEFLEQFYYHKLRYGGGSSEECPTRLTITYMVIPLGEYTGSLEFEMSEANLRYEGHLYTSGECVTESFESTWED